MEMKVNTLQRKYDKLKDRIAYMYYEILKTQDKKELYRKDILRLKAMIESHLKHSKNKDAIKLSSDDLWACKSDSLSDICDDDSSSIDSDILDHPIQVIGTRPPTLGLSLSRGLTKSYSEEPKKRKRKEASKNME
ncbi:unnamed protein product [Moneuplotes crassus]|uniref:Uncharacterized protein n=1 Tax=Euplotes crassus TaxID=5936 RepID=A0AAD1Y3W1_EUPCR|nr:unnamed protein product [Moneuplotes crassus]